MPVIERSGAYATMLRFYEEHPGAFCKKPAMRDGVEGDFSATRARFGGFVRALNKPNRAVELPFMTVCTA